MAKSSQKGLGKGLGALFSDTVEIQESKTEPRSLPLYRLEPNANQPRKQFKEEELEELAESIRQHGLIQPIAVRALDTGYYQIVAGERRWRACRIAGLDEVPVIIIDADDKEAAQLTLIENLQREDLNPLEEAQGYAALIEAYGFTQEEIADRVAKSRPTITNALRLLKLPKEILKLLENGDLSAGHARALIPLNSEKRQIEAANKIVGEKLTVRQTEQLVKRLLRPPAEPVVKDPLTVDYYKECEKELSQQLGRRVVIHKGKKTGKIEMEYYGDEDLQAVYEMLLSLKNPKS